MKQLRIYIYTYLFIYIHVHRNMIYKDKELYIFPYIYIYIYIWMCPNFRGPLRSPVRKFSFEICFVISFRGCILLRFPWAELTNANEPSWSRTSVHRIYLVCGKMVENTPERSWKTNGQNGLQKQVGSVVRNMVWNMFGKMVGKMVSEIVNRHSVDPEILKRPYVYHTYI